MPSLFAGAGADRGRTDPYCPACMGTGQLCPHHSGQDSTARGHVSPFNVLACTVDSGLDAPNSIPIAVSLRDLQYEEEVSDQFWDMPGDLTERRAQEHKEAAGA